MAHAASFHFDEDFPGSRLRAVNFLNCERLFELAQDGSFHSAHSNNIQRWTRVPIGIAFIKGSPSGLDGTNKEFHSVAHPLRQSVRSSEVHGPLTNHGCV